MERSRLKSSGNVCIVSSEFLGVTKNGGIGTAHSLLADLLASSGYTVTLLFTGVHPEVPLSPGIGVTAAAWKEKGVAFHYLDPLSFSRHDAPYFAARSISIFEWLLERDGAFDVVHFPEWQGDGYYTLAAKHQGLALSNSILLVNTHSPRLWAAEANRELPDDPHDLELDFMERRSVELADYVVSPSAYMLQWMKDKKWPSPRRASVIQNVMEPGLYDESHKQLPENSRKVSEIVYFGRLEPRKGLDIFCNAIERIPGEMLASLKITFLGRSVGFGGGTGLGYVQKCSTRWKCRGVAVMDDFDREEALQYLQGPGRIAVIPSRIENSPYTVLECVAMGIPLLAASTGGIPELVDNEIAAGILFAPNTDALSDSLKRAITQGLQPARLAVLPSATRTQWLGLYSKLATESKIKTVENGSSPPSKPKVNVCITHHERPELLLRTLQSFLEQDYPEFDVTVVDDGSVDPNTIARLVEIEKLLKSNNWRLIRSKNQYLGAARNLAAQDADGEYLVFFDDDNVAKPCYISTLVEVAEHCSADIVTCRSKYISEEPPGQTNEATLRGYVPLGAAPLVGFFRNCYGDAAALIRKSSFIKLGGFSLEREAACQDWELFSKAVLSGMKLEVVPKVLYYYRVAADSMYRTVADEPSQLFRIRPYLERFPQEFRPLALLAFGMWKKRFAGPAERDAGEEWNVLHVIVDTAKRQGFTSAHIYGAAITGSRLARAALSKKFPIIGFVDRDRSLIGSNVDEILVSGLTKELVSEAQTFLVGSFARGVEIAAAIDAAYDCYGRKATIIYVNGNSVITRRGGEILDVQEIASRAK
jgi:glycosyltransferase involved in cell wall biosynthesis